MTADDVMAQLEQDGELWGISPLGIECIRAAIEMQLEVRAERAKRVRLVRLRNAILSERRASRQSSVSTD